MPDEKALAQTQRAAPARSAGPPPGGGAAGGGAPGGGAGDKESGNAPGAFGRATASLRRAKGGVQLIGVLLLVAAGLALVAAIALGILENRTRYFEERNLRELDRIAADVNATSDSLAEVATLHFVPQQLHFSLSAMDECLVATTVVRGARQRPMTITYTFSDPERAERLEVSSPAQTPRPAGNAVAGATPGAGDEATGSTQGAGNNAEPDACDYRRGPALPLPRRVRIENGLLAVGRTVDLTTLLWPMTSRSQPEDLGNCQAAPSTTSTAGAADGREFIRRCFQLAALEDMGDQTYSRRGPRSELETFADRSIGGAFENNAIRINVSTPMQAVGLDTALEMFDAIQIIGHAPDHPERPQLLFQAGRVPAAIQGDELVERGLIGVVFGVDTPRRNARDADERKEAREQERTFLVHSQVERRGDVVLFQRTVPRLAGMECDPCRIVGIVDRAEFDRTVRKIDGVHATIFLIGVLTLIGFIPLLQLQLRRRLDPTRRIGQYVLWFSLTLLAASAAVSILSIWSSAASRHAGAAYARNAAETIGDAFERELIASLRMIRIIDGRLNPPGRSPARAAAVFPTPPTLPSPSLNAKERLPAGANVLLRAWELGSPAAIIETVAHFRGDGFIDREHSRLATGRLPAFGTTIADRSYFQRARNCDYDRTAQPHASGAAAQQQKDYILDRVFARPDGAPRVIWLIPTKPACHRESRGGFVQRLVQQLTVENLQPATSRERALAPPRERFFYNPTESVYLVASGSLRTFLRAELAPGFDYAVVDPRRAGGEPNVLFHSREGAELVERFENEIDNPEGFAAAVRELGAEHEPDEHQGESSHPSVRLDTNYRGQPARLTISKLDEGLGWLLVIIEDRNDAGYAIWRAATFGYGVWFAGLLAIGLLILGSHLSRARSLDRRPGLWLWPRTRLADFTPPRIARHVAMREWLRAAATARDRHIWLVLVAGLVGVTAGEAASRVFFAFGAALTVMAARAYFRGLTTFDQLAGRRGDRRMIKSAGVLIIISVIFFIPGMIDEYHFGGLGRGLPALLLIGGRTALFVGAVALLFACLREAWPHTRDDPDPLKPPSERWLQRGWDVGWMAALLILGGLPALAGFLDSHDYDRRLVAERQLHLEMENAIERRQAAAVIAYGRLVPLPRQLVAEVEEQAVRPPTQLASIARAERCLVATCFAIRYLGMREQALEFSDFAPFRMSDAFAGSGEPVRLIGMSLLIALPIAVLLLVMILFRRQYFRAAPLLSPGKDPEFDPPLSLTRRQFVERALIRVTENKRPKLPFAPAGGNLHLILGAGLDLRDDWWPPKQAEGAGAEEAEVEESETASQSDEEKTPRSKRLREVEGIAWVDLLSDEEPNLDDAKAVVIGNLDLALQELEPDAIETAYRRIHKIAGCAGTRDLGGRHVFLLAEVDPLDRIALLWNRQDVSHDLRRVEAWRWAELIQDFTLFPILADGCVKPEPGDTRLIQTIREELGVLDTSFAHELRDQLIRRFTPPEPDEKERRVVPSGPPEQDEKDQTAVPSGPPKTDAADEKKARAEEERIISFISEQMSDHFHKLWTSSSREEQVILHQVAADAHLKMADSVALRALLARGLLIRVPEYRLMNRSFTRYVLRVGEPSEIRRSAVAVGGVDRIWPLIRYPLAAIAGSAVLLLQFVAPSSGSAAVGALPALLALVPALLGRWFQDRPAPA